jgi:hypothetical protein
MELYQSLKDYTYVRIPPPCLLERSPVDSVNEDWEKKKVHMHKILHAFHWELPNALYYIHKQYERKKEQTQHGHVDTFPPDLNDYLASIQEGYELRQTHYKWTPLEKVIQMSRYMNGCTKETLMCDIRHGNQSSVLRYLWNVVFVDLDEEEQIAYAAFLSLV